MTIGQPLKRAQMTKDCENAICHESPMLLAQLWIVAEMAGKQSIGRRGKGKHIPE
jgi:hypothetical protein